MVDSVVKVDQIDVTRLDPYFIKENFVFGLGFPQSNGAEYIILRCIARDKPNYWLYDPLEEGLLSGKIPASTSTDGVTNHGYVTPQRPQSKKIQANPPFIFPNTPQPTSRYGYMYQIFFGISPTYLRVLFQQPMSTGQLALPVQAPTASYNQFGTILGKNTPIYEPGPESEIWVPPGLDFAIGFVNDTPDTPSPLIMWIVNYFLYEKVTDPDIIYEALNTTKYKSLRTVGGVTSYGYNMRNNFGQPGVTLGMSKAEIRAALGV